MTGAVSRSGFVVGRPSRHGGLRFAETAATFGDISVGVWGDAVLVDSDACGCAARATAPAAGEVLALVGDISNADTLASRLRVSPPTDRQGRARLALLAWRRWGDKALDLLEGAYCGALLTRRPPGVKVFRDITASLPVYLVSHEAASNDLAVALACEGRREPDPLFVAEYLQNQFLDPRVTPFRGLESLLPAHVATVRGGHWRTSQTARWHVRSIRHRSLDDYVDEFAHVLDDAVRARLGGYQTAAVSLSGGLDSTNVLASGIVVAPNVRWVAYSIPFRTPRGDETRLQRIVADHCGADLRWVPVDGRGPLGAPGPLFGGRIAPPWAGNWFFSEALAQAACDDRIALMFDGEDADSLLTGGRGYLSDLLIRGRWIRLQQVIATLHEHDMGEPRGLLKAAVAGILPPRLTRRLTPARAAPSPLVSVELAAQVGLAERLTKAPEARIWAPGRRFRAQQMLAGSAAQLATVAVEVGAAFVGRPVEAAHPFLDRRLMTFCMGLPWQAVHGLVTPKLILRELAKRRLPAEFTQAVRKADLSEYYDTAVFGHERAAVRRGLELALGRPEFVNIDAVRRVEHEFESCVRSWTASRIAMLMLWLESLETDAA